MEESVSKLESLDKLKETDLKRMTRSEILRIHVAMKQKLRTSVRQVQKLTKVVEEQKAQLRNSQVKETEFKKKIPVGARFFAPIQTGPGAHPASYTMGTGTLPGVESGHGVTLTPHPF
jgi:hypothetical protein